MLPSSSGFLNLIILKRIGIVTNKGIHKTKFSLDVSYKMAEKCLKSKDVSEMNIE